MAGMRPPFLHEKGKKYFFIPTINHKVMLRFVLRWFSGFVTVGSTAVLEHQQTRRSK